MSNKFFRKIFGKRAPVPPVPEEKLFLSDIKDGELFIYPPRSWETEVRIYRRIKALNNKIIEVKEAFADEEQTFPGRPTDRVLRAKN